MGLAVAVIGMGGLLRQLLQHYRRHTGMCPARPSRHAALLPPSGIHSCQIGRLEDNPTKSPLARSERHFGTRRIRSGRLPAGHTDASLHHRLRERSHGRRTGDRNHGHAAARRGLGPRHVPAWQFWVRRPRDRRARGPAVLQHADRSSETAVEVPLQQNLLVDVTAELDRTTRVVTWKFTTLDPRYAGPADQSLHRFLAAG